MFPRGVLTAVLSSAACLVTGVAWAQPVAVTYDIRGADMPILRAAVHDAASDLWHARASVDVRAGAGTVTLTATAGTDVVVELTRRGGDYFLDGPFRWPAQSTARELPTVPRRTIADALKEKLRSSEAPLWINGRSEPQEWPRCRAGDGRWVCVGVPLREPGVVALQVQNPVVYGVMRPGVDGAPGVVATRVVEWATLVIADPDSEARLAGLRVQLFQPRVSTQPAAGTRSMLERLPGGLIEPLSPDTFLVSGGSTRESVLLQIDGEDVAVIRESLSPASVSLMNPVRIPLRAPLEVSGRVLSPDGERGLGTRLELSEIISVAQPDGTSQTLKRLLMERDVEYADGRFSLTGLSPGRYELLAMNPRIGRGTVSFEPDGQPLVVRLAPGARVTGRVARNGVPLQWAWVEATPRLETYRKTADPLDVVAPSNFANGEGRFVLALPPEGAAEIRVSHEGASVRVPLPDIAEGTMYEIGDVDLPVSITVQVALVGDDRCVLSGTGPFGQTGGHRVEAEIVGPGARRLVVPEPGRWLLALRCGVETFRLDPAVIDVPPQVSEWSAHIVAVRR